MVFERAFSMRRAATAAVLMMVIPFHLHALTALGDEELAEIYSQAGISINPDITMNISIGVLAWGDQDGLEPGPYNPWGLDTEAGYIGIKDLRIQGVRVRLRTDPNDHFGGYDAATMCKPITIDVGTRSLNGGQTSFVRIGTGALVISMDETTFAVALGANP